MDAWEAAKNALECVLEAKKGESIVVFCDHEKIEIGNAFATGSLKLDLQTRLVPLKSEANKFRNEIPSDVMEILTKHPTDIYINLLRGVREETPFRIRLIKLETKGHKARLGHCPGVTIDMLTEGALALTTAEHRKMQSFAHELIRKLNDAEKLKITSAAGTDISLSVTGRPFFTDTMLNWETLKWMNLPTGEVIVAPVEDSMEGTLVCDLAIGGIGPLKTPVTLTVRNGKVHGSSCEDKQVLKRVKDSLNTDERSSTVGEFAFGINPKARFVEEFLEAEKMFHTIHIAFGNNSDMPNGKNPSANHMDFLVSKPTVQVVNKDGSKSKVLVEGVFQNI
ncbi:MAG TPA: aminopeptidase [Candidatus Bathyarchaeia archaeon]|jgi:leucyl aminopeptidase (aminopeptidase T)|nr:aminopeptidase [Candidatus Bathyarchaeia archaeon]